MQNVEQIKKILNVGQIWILYHAIIGAWPERGDF